jgi:hypothetical protein
MLFSQLVKSLTTDFSDLYNKHITMVNYDSTVVNRFGVSPTDDARGVIYDRHMFIVQATGVKFINPFFVTDVQDK